MPLVATTVKLESDKLELIKMKQVNVSQICRDAVDSYLKLNSTDRAVINSQIADLQRQRNAIDLEIKLLTKQLEAADEIDKINAHRESVYEKRKTNFAYMYRARSFDWHLIAEVLKFSSSEECKTWVLNRLKEDKLI
jgi:hypothetical protein